MADKKSFTLSIEDTSFSFGKKNILKEITLELEPGKIFALIGPNGAGKSTLFRLIAGLLPLQTGDILVAGSSLKNQTEKAKANQMLLTDDPGIYPYLTGREFLTMHAALRGISKSKLEKELPPLLGMFPEKLPLDELLGQQSRGTSQKIQIISALLTHPPLLLLDEPIVGLDPASVNILGKQLKDYVKTKTETGQNPAVILALHTLDFAQEFADEVGILHQGELKGVKKIGNSKLYSHYQKYVSK